MDKPIFERRRLLQWCILGALAAPVMVVSGCAQGQPVPRRRRNSGGNGGERGGGGGGPGRN